jgi:IQ calmodulin-binding motif
MREYNIYGLILRVVDDVLCSDAATQIQRVYRGHSGRRRANDRFNNRLEHRQFSLFLYFAVQIQRSFRGYYSRKYKRNHAARKAYFKSIAAKNEEILQQMQKYAEEQRLVRRCCTRNIMV